MRHSKVLRLTSASKLKTTIISEHLFTRKKLNLTGEMREFTTMISLTMRSKIFQSVHGQFSRTQRALLPSSEANCGLVSMAITKLIPSFMEAFTWALAAKPTIYSLCFEL